MKRRMKFIDDNNTGNMVVQGTTTAWMTSYLHEVYFGMLPWFAIAIPLILIDLKLGRKKAKLDGDKVTLNKSVRMTIDKTVSYLCWICLSTSMSMAFGTDFIKYAIMGIIYGLELVSTLSKWLYLKGMSVDEIEMFRILCKFIWNKVTGCQDELHDVFKQVTDDGKRKNTNTTRQRPRE